MYTIKNLSYFTEDLLTAQDDSRMIDEFIKYYNIYDSTYVSDAINYFAGEQVPVYTSNLLNQAGVLGGSSYWDSAVALGMLESTDHLDSMIAWVWECYNQGQLYNNEGEILTNIVINHFNALNEDGEISDDVMPLIETKIYDITIEAERFWDLETIVNEIMETVQG